jgi:hypothetical protein
MCFATAGMRVNGEYTEASKISMTPRTETKIEKHVIGMTVEASGPIDFTVELSLIGQGQPFSWPMRVMDAPSSPKSHPTGA